MMTDLHNYQIIASDLQLQIKNLDEDLHKCRMNSSVLIRQMKSKEEEHQKLNTANKLIISNLDAQIESLKVENDKLNTFQPKNIYIIKPGEVTNRG